VILGGGFAAWTYTQHQYFVGSSDGQVAIFRGVNQQVAGISLSSVYRRTGIPITQVTVDDRQQVMSTITASSLTDADKIVSSIRQGVQKCQQADAAQQKYQAAKKKYDQRLAAYQALKHKHRADKPTAPANPGPVPSNCPAGANAAAGGSSGSTGTGSPSSGPASPSTSGPTP
jgi:protein phosphatase